jgi:AcrR family transcriptional regulator
MRTKLYPSDHGRTPSPAQPPYRPAGTEKLATRQALGTAALRLAVEREIENVLVEDIAAEANVSPRTFNNYFSSKLEAMCALGMDRAGRIGATLRERPASEPLWDAITSAVLQHYDATGDTPGEEWMRGLCRVLTSPALQGEYLKVNAAIQRTLAEAIADRTSTDIERDVLPMILAGAVTAATEVALRHWLDAVPPAPLRPLLHRALQQLASALKTP